MLQSPLASAFKWKDKIQLGKCSSHQIMWDFSLPVFKIYFKGIGSFNLYIKNGQLEWNQQSEVENLCLY